jgi:hypothetical protein
VASSRAASGRGGKEKPAAVAAPYDDDDGALELERDEDGRLPSAGHFFGEEERIPRRRKERFRREKRKRSREPRKKRCIIM